MKSIYCDNNATTPVRPEVVEAMMPFYSHDYGNPSSIHLSGRRARAAVEEARERVAELIGASPEEIIFTSGGTESNNIAIRGALKAVNSPEKIITSKIEHHAVLETVKDIEKSGIAVIWLDADKNGAVSFESVAENLNEDTALLTIMHANNETGIIQDMSVFGKLARDSGVLFHTDAVQSVGKIHVDTVSMNVDLLSISAHKIGGPKGSGALFIRSGVELMPTYTGGHHERGLRPGTENVAGIVGLGKVCEIAIEMMAEEEKRIKNIRDTFEQRLSVKIPDVIVHGRDSQRLPGTTNVSFSGIEGEALLMKLDMVGIEVSTGSACASGSVEPSHVLLAMGVKPDLAKGSLRISFGWNNTINDVDEIMKVLPKFVEEFRAISL